MSKNSRSVFAIWVSLSGSQLKTKINLEEFLIIIENKIVRSSLSCLKPPPSNKLNPFGLLGLCYTKKLLKGSEKLSQLSLALWTIKRRFSEKSNNILPRVQILCKGSSKVPFCQIDPSLKWIFTPCWFSAENRYFG